MGKDAANTLFAENQEQAPEQFKGQSGILNEMNKGSGLELRQPEGDRFHGDMLKPETSAQYSSTPRPMMQDPMSGTAGGFHGDPLLGSQTIMGGDSHLTNRMGDEFLAGSFGAGEAMILKPHSSSLSSSHQSSFKTETFTSLSTSFDDRSAMSSDLHSSDMHGATHIHDGRHAGMLPDGRTVIEPALHDRLQDDTMRDATIHDGRSRPLVAESADSIPLAERVVAGVHAGDPLSRKSKLTSLFKKDKHKEDEFDKEGVLKGDHDLIPHEHLKKSELLAGEHVSGPAAMLTRQQNNFEAHQPLMDMHSKDMHSKDMHSKDTHLVNEVHILQPALQSALGPREHAVETFSARHPGLAASEPHSFTDSSHLNKELDNSHLSKDLDKSHLTKDSDSSMDELSTQGKGAKLKDKLHRKKEKLREKLHLKKDGSKRDELGESSHGHTETRANPKGHEIATIKIPGIESGDRAAQEMVNHQAKAKKELNAELKEHAGHSDHIAPSEILGHGMSQLSLHENRAVDSGADDALLKDNVLAKQAVNAEIKENAGMGFGLQHREFLPTELSKDQLQHDNLSQHHDQSLQAQQAVIAEIKEHAGTGFDLHHREILPTDQFQPEDLLAKQAVNAEIKESAGTGFGLQHLQILPTELSKDQFHHEDLSQRHDQFRSSDFQKDDDVLSKNLQQDFVPSTEKEDFAISEFQRRALHKNKALHNDHAEIQPSMTQTMKEKVTNAATAVKDTMGNMGSTISNMMPSSTSSAPVSEHAPLGVMDLKEDVHAEIKALGATSSDNIMPSDVSSTHIAGAPAAGLASFIPEKVTHAAAALKDTLGSKISSMMPSSSAPASAPATMDLEQKDVILAKDEVNAEIRALGATSSDNIMPSDISVAGAPAAGLASFIPAKVTQFIPEKVTHAAAALKDTLGSKISNMMPSSGSSTVPASNEVVIADLLDQTETVVAKNEINAEIRELGSGIESGTIMPSDISSTSTAAAPTAGMTVIHDGRSEIPTIADGAGRLKSEIEYEQAQDSMPRESEEAHLSMRQMIQEKVTNAAMAVKGTLHL